MFLAINEGISIDIDKIESIEDVIPTTPEQIGSGVVSIVHTVRNSYESALPRDLLLNLIEGKTQHENEDSASEKMLNIMKQQGMFAG